MLGVKQWMPLDDQCFHCGGDLQVLTVATEPDHVYDQDMVRCCECYCQGVVQVGDYDDVVLDWPDDMCAKCYREYDLG